MAYFLKNNNEDQNQSGNQNQMSGGNIYSTSGSEVSTPTSTSSNSSSNTSQSNESGNWMNLNKYLDANQGKVAGYVDSLASPYTSRVDDYTKSVESNKQQYINDVSNQNSAKFDSNKSKSVLGNYINNSDSVSTNDWKALQDTLKGYTGANQYSLTGDQYGYSTDKKTADDFGNFGSNFENQDYRMSLMDKNVSSGGKKLNNFLLGTQDAQQQISDYASKFRDLSDLLDKNEAEMNTAYTNAVNASNKNQKDALSNLSKIEAEQQKKLKDAYNIQKAQADADKYNLDKAVNIGNQRGVLGYKIANNTYNTYSNGDADSVYARELQELSDRINSIKNNTKVSGSKLDTDFNFGSWGLSPQERQRQEQRSLDLFRSIDSDLRPMRQATKIAPIYSLLDVNNYSMEGLRAKDIQARHTKGEITKEDALNQLLALV